jgi:hypothetical protein
MVIIIATSKQKVSGKNVTGKPVMTKKQREREIMKRRARQRGSKTPTKGGKQ